MTHCQPYALVGVALTGIVLVGLLGPAAVVRRSLPDDPVEVPSLRELRLATPENLTGTFSITVGIEVDRKTDCTVEAGGSGRFDPKNPVVFWIRTEADRRLYSQGVGRWSRGFQFHAGGIADTRDVRAVEGNWSLSGSSGGTVERSLNVTLVGFGLKERDDIPGSSPLWLDLDCDDPFNVKSLETGDTGRSWFQETLEEGVGATAGVAGVNPAFSRDDRLATDLDSPHVRFQAAWPIPLDPTMSGNLSLIHPGGSKTWLLPTDGISLGNYDGGPGRYTVKLDWRSATSDAVYGVVVGLDPVEPSEETVLRQSMG